MSAIGRTSSQLRQSQLTALHALFHLYAPRCLGRSGSTIERRERIAWAADNIGRPLESFSSLRSEEAARLIDLMKRALGQEVTPARRSAPWRRPDRDQARAYGTAGRRGNSSKEIQLVDAPTLELLERLLAQLGWTRARLDAFLQSKSSPVPGGVIRTLPQSNRVIWALKNMLRRAGTATSNSDQSLFDFARQREEG
jgi:hypothetical protein